MDKDNSMGALEPHAELVTRLLEIFQPAVRALGVRPLIADRFENCAGGFSSSETRASWRGICLTGKPGPLRGTRHNADVYFGSDVFLTEAGGLVELQYQGTWSHFGTGDYRWTATERAISVKEFCALQTDQGQQ